MPATINVDIEGCTIEADHQPITATSDQLQPGDLYIARRNTGWHLLTCHNDDTDNNWVVPQEPAYVYDRHECRRVRSIDNLPVT